MPMRHRPLTQRRRRGLTGFSNEARRIAAVAVILGVAIAGTALARPAPSTPPAPSSDVSRIVAIVNGSVVTGADIDNRARLFALSTNLPMTRDVLDRLTPQVIRQLIDERLRLQESQRRKIAVSDKQVAEAIESIEKDNSMTPGALRQRLEGQGVAMATLIDQVRTQIAWSRVLREQIGSEGRLTPQRVDAQEAAIKAQTGKPEYHVSEIFIPYDDPSHEDEARRFADTVIQQLRRGAPFAVVAAQFSQSQTALQGGDLGWVQPNQVDPEVARVIGEMPAGAVSNPIHVAGGFAIVSLREKRIIGDDPATLIKLASISLPFDAARDPAHPTDQQVKQLERAKKLQASAHGCDQLQAQAGGSTTPPQIIRLENVNPPKLREMLANLPDGKASEPLVSPTGITVVMPCARETKNLGMPSKAELANQLSSQRIERASRQLLRDLHRRAAIEIRNPGV